MVVTRGGLGTPIHPKSSMDMESPLAGHKPSHPSDSLEQTQGSKLSLGLPFCCEPPPGMRSWNWGGGQPGPGIDRREWLKDLTFWSRASTLVMRLLRIARGTTFSCPGRPSIAVCPGVRPHQAPSPTSETTYFLLERLKHKSSGRCQTS